MKIIKYSLIVNFADAALRCMYYGKEDARFSDYNTGKSFAYMKILEDLGYVHIYHQMAKELITGGQWIYLKNIIIDTYDGNGNRECFYAIKKTLLKDAIDFMRLKDNKVADFYSKKL